MKKLLNIKIRASAIKLSGIILVALSGFLLSGCSGISDKIKVEGNNVEVHTGNINVDIRDTNENTEDIDVETGNIDVDTGDTDVKTGNIDVDAGDTNANTGDVDVSVGDIDVSTGYEEGRKEIIEDYSDCFVDLDGCAVIYFPDKNTYTYYNKEQCQKQVSPFSTFKIVSTLIGLNNGVVESEESKLGYDGKDYSKEWNKDLTLKEAFKVSCVWYYRKLIDAVGEQTVKTELDKLKYGNCDISEWKGKNADEMPELSGFWLNSSLKISPEEQVDVLSNIFTGKTEYSATHIDILRNIMKADTTSDAQIYGKTGTGKHGIGWYTGYFVKNDQSYYFAVYINDKDQKKVSGYDAKFVLEQIINKHF